MKMQCRGQHTSCVSCEVSILSSRHSPSRAAGSQSPGRTSPQPSLLQRRSFLSGPARVTPCEGIRTDTSGDVRRRCSCCKQSHAASAELSGVCCRRSLVFTCMTHSHRASALKVASALTCSVVASSGSSCDAYLLRKGRMYFVNTSFAP